MNNIADKIFLFTKADLLAIIKELQELADSDNTNPGDLTAVSLTRADGAEVFILLFDNNEESLGETNV